MRKDTTKKFLMRENRFRGRMISNEIRELLIIRILNGKEFDTKFNYLTQDTISFINVLALKHTSKDTSNKPFFITKDKIKNIVVNKKSKQVSFNMIYCEEGSFTMGHSGIQDNPPKLETIERAFWLGETEVTQELYELIIGENPSHFKDTSKYPNAQKHPMEMATWVRAIKFCNKLSKLQGLDECYTRNPNSLDYGWDYDSSKNGYRLPTEKEWEYAAKAGTNNRWAGTNDEKKLGEYAWYNMGYDASTQPVATKKPNEWGFYDMTGNVWEWCWDKYDPNLNSASLWRVIRGGCWYTSNKINPSCLCSARQFNLPYNLKYDVGFRVCRSI